MKKLGVFILILQTLKLVVMMLFHFHGSRNIFMHFPFSCIPQVINKIELESATGILVVPLFTTQPWFTRLLRILTSEPLLLPKSHTCLYFPYRLRNPPNISNFRLIACHVSGKKYRQKGISPEITEVIMQSWKSGTGNKYNTYRKQWMQFSSERNPDPLHPHLNHFTLL